LRLKVIPQDQHRIDRDSISVNALKVINRLQNKGFQAYLVGGAVRDLLLGGHPKDFDIATDATPEQVHAQFRNSRIIGRRFQIVHVRFGREIIEVTTFRGHHGAEPGGKDAPRAGRAHRSADGLLLRDNVFGTLSEDAVRRDLTVNAFYYNPADGAIIDHVDGMQDLRGHTIRVIGDAATRYTEDPVRMLRVLRFAAKLDFTLAPDTAGAISECAALLGAIPPARLFDEFLKLFMSGYGAAALSQLVAHDLLRYLFPHTAQLLSNDGTALRLLQCATTNTDRRIAEGKPVTPAFILGAILWPVVVEESARRRAAGEPAIPALHGAAQEALRQAVQLIAIPRRFSLPMREIWELQQRLEQRRGRKAAELVDKRRFRAAYDFLLLREEAGEDLGGLGDWWTTFQELPFEERLAMAGRGGGRKQPRKKRLRSAS